MEPFTGTALSWRLSDRVIELAMHLLPANEMGSILLAEFDRFLTAFRSDGSQAAVMIVYSEIGSAFSAGGDLRELYVQLQSASSPYADSLVRESVRQSHSRLNAMDELPLVTIAAVSGICFGSGFELALTCDLMIADKTARFCFPEMRLGLIPGGGGIPRLKRVVGNGLVRDLLLTGRSINAAKALSVGIVSQLVAEGEALNVARFTATQIKKFDASARLACKRFIKTIPADEMEREIEVFSQLLVRPVVKEALKKFVESPNLLPYLP